MQFNPRRLVLARNRRRLTGRILAEQSRISPITLSRIENGKQEPDDETIEKLVRVLAYPREFFFLKDIDDVNAKAASFRSLTSMSALERDAALASGKLALEIADWVNARFNLPAPDIPNIEYQIDPTAAATSLRRHWSIGEKPIGNLVKLLEAKGVRVFSLAENTRSVDAFSYWRNNEPFIFLNSMKTAERSRFDAAHELGHLMLHKHGGPPGRDAEHQANQFASAFLMPQADVEAKIPFVSKLADLIVAKKRWGVSLYALVFRLHKLGKLSDWQYRGYCIQIEREFGSSEPNGIAREQSTVWEMILRELWREGITRHHIADHLKMPREELDTLLFGLAGEAAFVTGPRPPLRAV